MKQITRRMLFGAVLAAAAAGCGEKRDPVFRSDCAGVDAATVTYTEDVEPIIRESCIVCHSSESTETNQPADIYDFDTYSQVRDLAERIFLRASAGTMPPPADAERLDLPPLTEEQICLLQTWYEAGAPE